MTNQWEYKKGLIKRCHYGQIYNDYFIITLVWWRHQKSETVSSSQWNTQLANQSKDSFDYFISTERIWTIKKHGMIFIWGNILPVLPTLIIFTSLPKKEMMKAVRITPCSILLSLWNCLITMKYIRIYWSLFMKSITTIKRS